MAKSNWKHVIKPKVNKNYAASATKMAIRRLCIRPLGENWPIEKFREVTRKITNGCYEV